MFKLIIILFSIAISNQLFAFYLECKDVNDSKSEVRIFQNDNSSNDLILFGQTTIRGTSYMLPLNMKKSSIAISDNRINGIQWENTEMDLGVYIVISDEILNDGQDIQIPLPFKTTISIDGKLSRMKIIDSDSFACRQFKNN